MSDAELFHLVTKVKPKAEPHLWGAPVSVAARPELGRYQQTERTCPKCSLVKVTVHPTEGGGWREWRWGGAPCQFADAIEPECLVMVDVSRSSGAAE